MTSFEDFRLAEPIARALVGENYVTPTPIQAQTIPLALAGRDIVGIAQTGTGKTAAFALPILQRLFTDAKPRVHKSCRVLVLSPTRELSGQITDSFNTYGKHMRVSATLAIGGVPIGRQKRALYDGVDVLVATPGRLLDLLHEKSVILQNVEVLVLDEADRMLDMGFIHDIRKVLRHVPRQRQTLFFSATMPQAITDLAKDMLNDPARVAVTPVASTAERIVQRVIHVDRGGKPALLSELLKSEPVDRALIFTRTKHGADKVVRGLAQNGIPSEAIHGNKSQNNRERTLGAFRSGIIRVLVATDIASRGIDVDRISHVFNYDMPNIPENYVHRIGRTARAGAEGTAISLVDREEAAFLRDIERLIRMTIPSERRGASPRAQGLGLAANGLEVADIARVVQREHEQSRSSERPRGGEHRGPKRGGDKRRPHSPGAGERHHAGSGERKPQANGERHHANGGERKPQSNSPRPHANGGERKPQANGANRHQPASGGRPNGAGGNEMGGLRFMKPNQGNQRNNRGGGQQARD